MSFENSELMSQDAMVTELLRPLEVFLRLPQATEIVINRPGEVFVECGAEWKRFDAPALSMEQCCSLANAIASFTCQTIDADSPLLSADLPGGQRIQIAVPPACERETVSITIRVPGTATRTLDQYQTEGFFSRYKWAGADKCSEHLARLSAVQRKLVSYLIEDQFAEFLQAAVRTKQNIVFVGDTGCGKTSLMKTACQLIPRDERLITIEDVREIRLEHHPNRTHLLYSRNAHQHGVITPGELIASAMRMRPDRVLLAELRGAEAFEFLKLLTTGHSGSISSYHAESCALAHERYVFMCKEHPHAAVYSPSFLKELVNLTIDVIVHIAVARSSHGDNAGATKERFVSEVYFDPVRKIDARLCATPHRPVETRK